MFSRIYLEITNCCNLSCAFCPGTRRARRMLPAEEFRLLAGKLRPWTDYLYLHVLGEPLLHPQLAEILASAGELGFRVCLVTNGTLLAQRVHREAEHVRARKEFRRLPEQGNDEGKYHLPPIKLPCHAQQHPQGAV